MIHLKTQIKTITSALKPERKGSQPRAGPTAASGTEAGQPWHRSWAALTQRHDWPPLNTDPHISARWGVFIFALLNCLFKYRLLIV